jgi:quercetin dioxygenase-like cupin family protein
MGLLVQNVRVFPMLSSYEHGSYNRSIDASDDKSRVTLVYDQALPNVPGKSIRGVLVEYKPGGLSPAHTHPNSAFIYATVLEGAIQSQVNDGRVTTYRAGESFSELPGDRHAVSKNASTTEPARLLAVFVVDTNETTLTTPGGSWSAGRPDERDFV